MLTIELVAHMDAGDRTVWKPQNDDPVGGAYAAGRMARAIFEIRHQFEEGRVVVCTHGDTLPAFAAFLVGAHGVELPALPPMRGSWYTIRFGEDGNIIAQLNSLENFPSAI